MPLIQLLGAVGAHSDGVPLELGAARQRAALACLALAHPRPTTVPSITQALWGEEPTSSSRNAIQVYVSGLRKALRDCGTDVARIGDGYALRGTDLVVDVTRFDELVAEGRAALRSGNLARSAAALEEGLALWVGRPLDGLGELPFLESARAQLAATRALALADLAQCYLRSGRPDDAVTAGRRLVNDHRYDEHGWVLLATAHYSAGRQAEALEVCRTAGRIVIDELGVDPSPELAELEGRILRQEIDAPRPAEGSVAGPSPDPAAALPELPDGFVGRGPLVAEVVSLVAGGHRLTAVTGMGGIGKTSLAVAAARQLVADGFRVGFVSLETDVAAVDALERVCRAFGIDPDAGPVQALAAGVDERLDVLVLDNLEQVAGIADALAEVLEGTRTVRVLLTSRLPLRLRQEQVVLVPPLDIVGIGDAPSSAVQLFLAAASRAHRGFGRTATLDDAQELCRALGGIPLAIELVAARARVLTTRQMIGRLTASGSALDGGLTGVPARQATMARVIDATYDMLADRPRDLLRLLAEIDGPVPLDYLEADGSAVTGPDLLDTIDDLVAGGLVAAENGALVVHVPVRDVLRRRPDRQRYTRAAVELAIAFTLAGPADISGAAAAAEIRRLSAADDVLVSVLHRCLDNAWAVEASALVIRVHRYWLLTGRIVEGRRWLDAVGALPGAAEPARTQVRLLAGCFASYVNDTSAIGELTEALSAPAAAELPRDRILVNSWCCLAALLAHHDRIAEARQAAAKAVAHAGESGSRTLIALARDLTGHVAAYAGDHQQSLEANLGGLADARSAGDDFDVVQLLCAVVDNLMALGRSAEAVRFADEAFDRAGGLEIGHLLPAVLLSRGMAHTLAGNLTVAGGDLIETLRVTRERFPDPLFAADALYLLGYGAIVRDDDAGAPGLFGAAEALYEEQGVVPGSRTVPMVLAARESFRRHTGAESFDTASDLGHADPAGVIERLIARPA